MEVKLNGIIFLTLVLSHTCKTQLKAKQKCATFVIEKRTFVIEKSRIARSTTLPEPINAPEIAGGESAYFNEFPHMVALGYGDSASPQFLCGGSLISDQYVLTAAHCSYLSSIGSVTMIRAGTNQLTDATGFKDITVQTIINHPEYKSPNTYNDIALLKLSRKVSYVSNILPACLHTSKELSSSQETLTALGWGKVDFTGPVSDNLQKVKLQFYPISKCNASYKDASKEKLPIGLRDDIQLCAGGTIGKDTCQGDSGGPLEYLSGKVHYIVGLTSFGKACGISADPGVYARVSAYVPWIESIVWPQIMDS